jgi:pimeloyl-ACP methyl ester carboxylesterase
MLFLRTFYNLYYSPGIYFKNIQNSQLVTYPYKTHQVQLPGNVNITYIDEGSAEKALLFIHGLANYALCWKKNIDYLRQFYRCIAIDLPGNGLSDRNEHPFGLKNLTIIGHSMGGQIAMTAVINHPECAQSLVLCAPAGFERFTALDKTLYYGTLQFFDYLSTDEFSLRKTVERGFYHFPSQAENMITELIGIVKANKAPYYKKMLEGCVRGLLEEIVYDKLQTIKQPTLILFGKKDELIPNKLLHHISTEKLAAEAVKEIPGAKLKLFPDCGHFVQWEKADEVNKDIIMFLEGEMKE